MYAEMQDSVVSLDFGGALGCKRCLLMSKCTSGDTRSLEVNGL